jgi:hypothetical protein
MKRFFIALALPLLLMAGIASAERPVVGGLGLDNSVASGNLKVTQEMWFYDQAMRQYRNPKAAIRARAEYRAAQRIRRLESMKWFGMSNSRPVANPDPFNGDYAPRWTANPGYYPSRWNGVAGAP